jgi:4-aminobutyrate aminotransferase-like enzyme
MAPLSNLQTRAVETLLHPYTNQATFRETGPLVIERGKGVYVYDTDGKAYLRRHVDSGARRSATTTRNWSRPQRR